MDGGLRTHCIVCVSVCARVCALRQYQNRSAVFMRERVHVRGDFVHLCVERSLTNEMCRHSLGCVCVGAVQRPDALLADSGPVQQLVGGAGAHWRARRAGEAGTRVRQAGEAGGGGPGGVNPHVEGEGEL